MEISVEEAAVTLGVSPSRVRQLLDRGQLGGRKIGRVWVVDDTSIAHRQRRIGSTKLLRRTTPRRAWGELHSIAQGRIHGSMMVTAFMSTDLFSLQNAVSWFRSRATLHVFDCHTRVAERLLNEPWVVTGGARRAAAAGAPIDPGSDVDVYVPSSAMDELRTFIRARPSMMGNLCVREVEDASWLLPSPTLIDVDDNEGVGRVLHPADRERLADVAAVLDMGESLDERVAEVAAGQWADLMLTWADNVVDVIAQRTAHLRAAQHQRRLPSWIPAYGTTASHPATFGTIDRTDDDPAGSTDVMVLVEGRGSGPDADEDQGVLFRDTGAGYRTTH